MALARLSSVVEADENRLVPSSNCLVIQISPAREDVAQPHSRVTFPHDVPARQLRREADARAQAGVELRADRGGGEEETIHVQWPRRYCASG